jgi:hypothetical protein
MREMSLLKESLEISYVTMGKFLIASITVWVQVLCSSAQCFHYHSLLQASHLLLKPSNCEERGMLELGLLHYSKMHIPSLLWCLAYFGGKVSLFMARTAIPLLMITTIAWWQVHPRVQFFFLLIWGLMDIFAWTGLQWWFFPSEHPG